MTIHSLVARKKFSAFVVAGGLLLLLVLAMLGPGNALACGASPGGNPGGCGGGGPATQINPNIQTGGGNPINLINGNKYQEETDLAPLPGVLGLELKRHYNSQSTYAGWMGAGWRTSYETVLYDLGGQIQIVQADGRRLMFQRGTGSNAALCSSPQIQDGQVRIEPATLSGGQATYHWRWPDGRTLTFSGGKGGGFPLREIKAPGGQRLVINYHLSGELANIVDPQGRELVFSYGQTPNKKGRVLQAVDTPLGRITYGRDDLNRVTEVAYFEKAPVVEPSKQKAPPRAAPPQPYQTKIYHYEDSLNAGNRYALTGISVRGVDAQTQKPTEQRLSTYAYNAAGLAIMSTKGRPREEKDGQVVDGTGIEQVDVNIVETSLPFEGQPDKTTGEVKPRQLGKTILTNSLGQKTEIKHTVIGGNYRLIEMRGPGCSTCGPSNMRYAYDVDGRVLRETQLNSNGRPLRSEVTRYDIHGRVAQVGMQRHSGKPGTDAVQWIRRYDYADVKLPNGRRNIAMQPSLIARPSVVEGKDHVVQLTYNERDQLTGIKESGWSPATGNGTVATSIEKATTYEYGLNRGVSVLLTKLEAGRQERYEIDNATGLVNATTVSQVTASIPKNNRNTGAAGITIRILERDDTGQPVHVGINDGIRLVTRRMIRQPEERPGALIRLTLEERAWLIADQQPIMSSMRISKQAWVFNAAGELIEAIGTGGERQQMERDAQGRVNAIVDTAGNRLSFASGDDESPGRQWRTWLLQDPGGKVQAGEMRLDVNGSNSLKLKASVVPPAQASQNQPQVPGPTQKTEFPYAATTAPEELPLTKPGTVFLSSEPDRLQMLDAEGGAHALFRSRAGVGYIDPAGRASALLLDDFGRPVLEATPDEGRIRSRYQVQSDGRIEVTRIHTGLDGVTTVQERLLFDATGKLTARVRGLSPSVCRESMHYEGQLLQAIEGCDNTHRFERDAFGRITRHDQTISHTPNGANPTAGSDSALHLSTSYRYDAAGRVDQRTLSDGKVLKYTFNTSNQPQAVLLRRSWMGAIAHVNAALPDWLSQHLPSSWAYQTVVQDVQSAPLGGRIVATTAANGLTTEQALDAAGQVSALRVFRSRSTPVLSQPYRYNNLGQLVQIGVISQTVSTPTAATPDTMHYAYDLAGRLTEQSSQPIAAPPSGLMRTTYTPAGTPLDPKSTSVATSLAYTPLGRRIEATVERDAFGRQAHNIAPNGQVQNLLYDDAHRLIEVQNMQQQALAKYRYDALGNRVAKTVYERPGDATSAITSYYQYDLQHRLVGELNEQGHYTRQTLYAGYAPIAQWQRIGEAESLYAIHADTRGLPQLVTDGQAQVVWKTPFDAWGADRLQRLDARSGQPPTATHQPAHDPHLRLAGQVFDPETGLHYNVHRYYDPRAGRYLTPDPLGWLHGDERYAYVNSNPLGGIDPLGLFEIPVANFLGGVGLPSTDHGHGDILRAAFSQYNAANGLRFSQTIIDAIVLNNYHSDAAVSPLGSTGAGQFNFKNHFDNPNNGPMCQDANCTQLMPGYTAGGGGNPDWVAQSLGQINANRGRYTTVVTSKLSWNISTIISSFGQNSHALADFYAHTNWVDAPDRGGKVCNDLGFFPIAESKNTRPDRIYVNVPGDPNKTHVYEVGYVPVGLDETRLWDESISSNKIYSGTVNSISEPVTCPAAQGGKPGDIGCVSDKTTHGYWNKDEAGSDAGKKKYSQAEIDNFSANGMFVWKVETFNPAKIPADPKLSASQPGSGVFGKHYLTDSGLAPKGGDRIYVAKRITNRHEMAMALAIEHTKMEISKLYASAASINLGLGAGVSLHDAFKMNHKDLAQWQIKYQDLLQKD